MAASSRWCPAPTWGRTACFNRTVCLGSQPVSPTDIWAFGSYFAADGSGNQMTLLLHWNGTVWSIASSPNPTNQSFLADVLFAGVVPSPGNVWIVGSEDALDTLAIHTTNGGK